MIVATGYQNEPVMGDWPGRDGFCGRLLHSAEYVRPEPFSGDRVLVVGPGCSGMEIADELANHGAVKVWLAVRTPPNILLRRAPGGIPGDMLGVMMMRMPTRLADAFARLGRRAGIGDLSAHGLPIPEEGVMSRLRRLGATPAIVDAGVIDTIKARRIEVVPAVDSFDAGAVRLRDGSTVEPDAVICATGYRPALESLVGDLAVLDEQGRPRPSARRLPHRGFGSSAMSRGRAVWATGASRPGGPPRR